jgi:hypothetical protein
MEGEHFMDVKSGGFISLRPFADTFLHHTPNSLVLLAW